MLRHTPTYPARGSAARGAFLLLCAVLASPSLVAAQQTRDTGAAPPGTYERPPRYVMTPLVVTATRAPRSSFELAVPVAAVDSLEIRRIGPNTAADLFRRLPGLDVNGVGPNQTRPMIRGQRGQRILLLEDGLRLNNTRRQQDFGELPAIVDVGSLDRVEVVRGPASVLYGSDAIGGAVNLITGDTPPLAGGDTFGGRVEYMHRGAGAQNSPSADLFGRVGKLGFAVSGMFRDADPYVAPAGSFGDVTLAGDVLVNDTGVRDRNLSFRTSFDFDSRNSVFAKLATYDAENAGFGYVSNEDLGAVGAPTIQILYPDQAVRRLTLGYRGTGLATPIADRLDVRAYRSDNERRFDLDVFIPFSPQTPESGISVVTNNFTDVETLGFRAEAAKAAGGNLLFTYGVDYFNDDSNNTDRSVTTLVGAGPPTPEVSDVPLVPRADYRSLGVFAQGDIRFLDRVSLVAGARYQGISAETHETPNSDVPLRDFSEGTFVAAANLLVGVTGDLNLAVNVGRGFRAPNLIELFFEGPTPEGNGYQVVNTDLQSETSLNVDVGLKLETERVSGEVFYFRNDIDDGIRIEPTGEIVGPLPAYRNVNVDQIRYQGVEVAAEIRPIDGVAIGGSYSWLDAKDVLDPSNPIGQSYGSKLFTRVRYADPGGLFWAEYAVRHSGESRDGQVLGGPVGDVLPAFTVHDIRGGVRLFERGRVRTGLLASVTNLTNELYAEASNASFFRPQPKRALQVGLTASF